MSSVVVGLPDGLLEVKGGLLRIAQPDQDYLRPTGYGAGLLDLSASSITSGTLGLTFLPVVDVTHGGLGVNGILAGVLKGDTQYGYSGAATTSDVPEGTNKYWTEARFVLGLQTYGVAFDAQVMHIADAETITGAKTFTASLLVQSNLTAYDFIGSGSGITSLNASHLTSGMVPSGVLGTGNATNSTFLRGDGTWQPVAVAAAGAGGDNLQLQYNSQGVLTGAVGLIWDATGNRLILTASSQQPANMMEWRTAGGAPVTHIDAAGLINGSGANLTALNASNLAAGTVPTTQLGSGTASQLNFLRGDQSWAVPPGVPAGADGQLQYNASGSFGSNSGIVVDYQNNSLSITQSSLSTSKPALNTQSTWDEFGVTYTNWFANVLDVASNTNSMLLDLQVGGSSKFSIDKSGGVTTTGTVSASAMQTTSLAVLGTLSVANLGVSGTISTSLLSVSSSISATSINASGAVSGASFSGSGGGLFNLNATNLSTGTVPTARLGTGAANNATFLRGDNTWSSVMVEPQPGGSNTSLQYNQAGSLAGDSGLVWDYTNTVLAINQSTNTGTSSHPAISTQTTWNNASGVFTHWLARVTNTNSDASSKLLDLQVNSSSVFSVGIGGSLTVTGGLTVSSGGLIVSSGNISAANLNITAAVSASIFSGSGAGLTNLNASNLSSGTVPSAQLGSGTASATTYLRGDGTWSNPSLSGGGAGTNYGPGANKPVAGMAGRVYVPSDGAIISVDTGTTWVGLNPFGALFSIPPAVVNWTAFGNGSNVPGNANLDIPGGGITLRSASANTNGNFCLQGIYRSLTGGTYDVRAALQAPMYTMDMMGHTSDWAYGMCVSDGTQFIIFGWSQGGANVSQLGIQRYPTANQFTQPAMLVRINGINAPFFQPTAWLRISSDGTNRHYWASLDGLSWMLMYQEAARSYLSETFAGIFTSPNPTNVGVSNFINILSWSGV
jgi:hypothetical protein